ncbi:MAG TPA: molecular chaperone Tir, partial [Anaerolineae bacterium]|nr:molecular chaperone Tir [Anaerolineae bacterium]
KEREDKARQDQMLNQIRTLSAQPSNQFSFSNLIAPQPTYDAFISHATEDKNDVVRSLAELLRSKGFAIWYDEFELTVGDGLRRSIDKGLANSRFGIVILSTNFFAKNWTNYELDGLVSKEMEGRKVILPIWHKISKDEVTRYSPTLADKLALNTAMYTIEELANELAKVLKTD